MLESLDLATLMEMLSNLQSVITDDNWSEHYPEYSMIAFWVDHKKKQRRNDGRDE
jgi:hypothetical protein